MEVLDLGIYTMTEAARLLRLRPARIREWFQSQRYDPIFKSDYAASDKVISFLDLIDALVATKLFKHGFSLQQLRVIYERLEKNFNCPHPFSRKELLTDGQQIFERQLSDTGETALIEAMDNQKVFPKIMLPFLETIDYDVVTQLANRWNIQKGILIDPKLCLGKPVVKRVAIPTRILAREYAANDRNAKLVADWYEITAKDVKAAYKFEQGLTAA